MFSSSILPLFYILFVFHPAHASNTWTVNCDPLTIQRSDPIVDPGIASGHVHAVAGGTAFQRTMTGETAIDSLATTCDKFTDHSNYWCPQLYQMTGGQFALLPFTGVNSYYENYTCSYSPSGVCPTLRDAIAFPPGLRMIAGDSSRRTLDLSSQWDQAILFDTPNGEIYGLPSTLSSRLQADVRFPSCWDGINLDSPDHQSHVAYPDPSLGGNTQGGMCPSSHPVALISIGAEFGFDLQGVTDPSSLVFSNGDTTGYGFHGDFLQGWTNSTALQDSFANCFTNDECPWRNFDAPGGVAPNPSTQSPEVAPIYEEIGLNGPIPTLPGNNPVYTAGVGAATSVVSSIASAASLSTNTAMESTPPNSYPMPIISSAISIGTQPAWTSSTTTRIPAPSSVPGAIYITLMLTETETVTTTATVTVT